MMDEYLLEMKVGAGCSASASSAGHRKEVAKEHELVVRKNNHNHKERGELRC